MDGCRAWLAYSFRGACSLPYGTGRRHIGYGENQAPEESMAGIFMNRIKFYTPNGLPRNYEYRESNGVDKEIFNRYAARRM